MGMEGVSQTSKKVLNRGYFKKGDRAKILKHAPLFACSRSARVGMLVVQDLLSRSQQAPRLIYYDAIHPHGTLKPELHHHHAIKRGEGKSDRVSDTFFGPPQGCHCARGEERADFLSQVQ